MNAQNAISRALEDAKSYVASDPPAALFKARFVGEALASFIADEAKIVRQNSVTQDDFIKQLEVARAISPDVADRLHRLRIAGNSGVHRMEGTAAEAQAAVSLAESLMAEVLLIRRQKGSVAQVSGASTKPSVNTIKARLAKMQKAEVNMRKRDIQPMPISLMEYVDFILKKIGLYSAYIIGIIAGVIILSPVGIMADMLTPFSRIIAALSRIGMAFVLLICGIWVINSKTYQGIFIRLCASAGSVAIFIIALGAILKTH